MLAVNAPAVRTLTPGLTSPPTNVRGTDPPPLVTVTVNRVGSNSGPVVTSCTTAPPVHTATPPGRFDAPALNARTSDVAGVTLPSKATCGNSPLTAPQLMALKFPGTLTLNVIVR